ncbi:DUF3325 domain-containing protein [Idiomarina sp. HP20-50]|uniref:DUF3325 domain-containing protein n=1 Tax=Idiomarina sp. HP20-50 TaxID=3070813 RepID=UPI003981E992
MIALLMWLFSIAGFWLLCIVTARHRKLFNLNVISSSRERVYKLAGFTLLASGLACTVFMPNAVDALLVWFGVLTFSSLIISGLLTYKRQHKHQA